MASTSSMGEQFGTEQSDRWELEGWESKPANPQEARRRFRRRVAQMLAALLLTLPFALAAGPATGQQAGGGSGVVTGEVTITSPPSGIPPHGDPPTATTFEFVNTIITGPIVVVSGTASATYVGPIDVEATGGSPSENADGATGTVDEVIIGPNTTGPNSISGSLSGVFVRIGPNVTVTLYGNIYVTTTVTVDGITITTTICAEVHVTVVAEFVPTAGAAPPPAVPGVTTGIKKASFAGSWTAVQAP